jgi:hypothetical protein
MGRKQRTDNRDNCVIQIKDNIQTSRLNLIRSFYNLRCEHLQINVSTISRRHSEVHADRHRTSWKHWLWYHSAQTLPFETGIAKFGKWVWRPSRPGGLGRLHGNQSVATCDSDTDQAKWYLLNNSISFYGSTALVDLGPFSQFLNLYTFGRTPWMGDQPVARPILKRKQKSMPRVGFEPTIPVFEREKTVQALDRQFTFYLTENMTRIYYKDVPINCYGTQCVGKSGVSPLHVKANGTYAYILQYRRTLKA